MKQERFLNGSIAWLFWSEFYDGALSLARNTALGPDSDVTLALPDGMLYNLYKYHPSLTRVFAVRCGLWNRSGIYMEYFYRHRIKFEGTPVKAATVVSYDSTHSFDIPTTESR